MQIERQVFCGYDILEELDLFWRIRHQSNMFSITKVSVFKLNIYLQIMIKQITTVFLKIEKIIIRK